MSVFFSAAEVVTMAIEIEKNGISFYNTMAANTDDEKSKEIYALLVGEEVKHKLFFQRMLDNLPELKLDPSEEEEYKNYLGALTSSRIFTANMDPSKMLKDVSNDIEALDLAIGFEKDSILFFHEVKDQALEEDKPMIEKVIKEEKSHFAMLSSLRESLSR